MQRSVERRRILVTGATGTVGLPVALSLAEHSEVIAVARFSESASRESLEAASVQCVACDLDGGDFSAIPRDVDHVIHFARPADRALATDFDAAVTGHAEAIGLLMAHCAGARSVLHCSSTSMYARTGRPARENDPLTDDRHRIRPTYTLGKICAEAVVRTTARQLGLPTTIARLNVPYSDNGGWPALHLRAIAAGQPVTVHPDGPNRYNPIHTDDIARTIPALLEAARVPATIVNWAGTEIVSIEEWCTELGELIGRPARFVTSEDATQSVTIDTSKLVALAGPMTVDWRDGMRRLARTLYPGLVS